VTPGARTVFTGMSLACAPIAEVFAGDAGQRIYAEFVRYAIGGLFLAPTIMIVFLLVQSRTRGRRRLQSTQNTFRAETAHTARLALAGEMTASIAHEVTQPLSAILNNVEAAELLLGQPTPDMTAIAEILADIKRDDLRANEIVRRLRTLLGKRELQRERTDVNALAATTIGLIRADASRRNIVIRTDLQPDLPLVMADPVHLQQVLLNLMVNAMDAMKDSTLTARWLDVHTSGCEGEAVEIAILDTGHGMSRTQLSKVFDSFFTTKEGGMGLGLSIARSIVQAHGGAIWAERREAGGTMFRFTVPVNAKRVAPPQLRAVKS